MNSLAQGGLPVDVAETIAWLAPARRPAASTATSCASAARACWGPERMSRRTARCAGPRSIAGARRLPGASAAAAATTLPDAESCATASTVDRGAPGRLRPGVRLPARATSCPPPTRTSLAFPLAMALMTEPSFPFPLLGLVHIANRIDAAAADRRATSRSTCACGRRTCGRHERGHAVRHRQPTASVDGELVWRSAQTYLRRGGASGESAAPRAPRARAARADGASGGCPATSAAATPRCPATATRSTCTR